MTVSVILTLEDVAPQWLQDRLDAAGVTTVVAAAVPVPEGDDDRIFLRIEDNNDASVRIAPRGHTGIDVFCGKTPWLDEVFLTAIDGVLWTLPDVSRHRLAALALKLVGEIGHVVVVLQQIRFPDTHMRALLDAVVRRFSYFGKVVFCVTVEIHDHVVRLLDGGVDVVTDPRTVGGPLRAAVFMDFPDLSKTLPQYLAIFAGAMRHYVFMVDNQNTYLKILQRDGNIASLQLDAHSQPQFTEHHLSRMVLETGGTVVKFAFGSLQIMSNELGPVDSLGFRIGGRFDHLAARKAEHRVIAFLGGSAAFGWRCFHDGMFTALLERSLNSKLQELGKAQTVSVLNFSISGHAILDEMRSFMLFIHNIRPDLVISHGGFNDFFYGGQIDPVLVERYGLIYCHVHDQVIRTAPEPTSEKFAGQLVDAYVSRLRQFEEMVRGNGGAFIFGRQPIWAGKALTVDEIAGVNHWLRVFSGKNPTGDYRQMMDTVMYLYPQLQERLNNVNQLRWLDVHAAIVGRGTETVFFDPVHMTPRGHALTAEFYHDHLLSFLLNQT